MPQKNSINGFWLFAQNNRSKWKAQGLRVTTGEELLGIAHPLWKSLTLEERKKWDTSAKEERKRRKMEGGDGDGDRLDNTGNAITMRRDLVEERRLQREREVSFITEQWKDKDLTEEKFYLISFQDLCETTSRDNFEKKQWLPREMALIQFTLSKGITQIYHQFIWPGSIPLGFRLDAEKKSEEGHQIPTEEMEEDSHDYRAICRKAMDILGDSMKQGRYPPVYCLDKDYEKMMYLCDWLWFQSGLAALGPSPLGRVYCLEDLVKQLFSHSGNPNAKNINISQIARLLEGSQWDYATTASCDFHKNVEVAHDCALASVKKYAYSMSDMLAIHYNIQLSEKHVPVHEEKETAAVPMVLPSAARAVGRGRGSRKSAVKQAMRETTPGAHTPVIQEHCQERERRDNDDERFLRTSVVDRVPPTSVLPPGSPVVGQFADMPAKDTFASDSDENEEGYPPAAQMSNLSLSETPSVWTGGRGGGLVASPAVSAPVRPPPGFASNPVVAGVGGMNVAGAWTRSAPPVGRGARPTSAASQAPVLGRGMLGVGRGSLPRVGPAATVGRGRMADAGRRPAGSSEAQPLPGGVSFGRGFPLGPSPAPARSFPAPAFGRAGLPVDTDAVLSASRHTDSSSPFGGGGGDDGARGVHSGEARGVTVGRGMMLRGGRGFMPGKGVGGRSTEGL